MIGNTAKNRLACLIADRVVRQYGNPTAVPPAAIALALGHNYSADMAERVKYRMHLLYREAK